jgi:origin recognition complex subunit 1
LNQHYNYCSLLTGDESTRKPTLAEMDVILTSLVSSKAMLVEEGALASRKDKGEKKVALAIEQTEIERVLGDIGGERWKSVLGAS